MTESELQEEMSILNLACGQLGNELAQGRLQVAHKVYATLGSIMKKFAAYEAAVAERGKINGRTGPDQPQA